MIKMQYSAVMVVITDLDIDLSVKLDKKRDICKSQDQLSEQPLKIDQKTKNKTLMENSNT